MSISREILKVAIAQLCQGAGFARTQETACELLVDVVLKYIETIGLVARDSAEHAGRTEANFADVHTALLELEMSVPSLTEFARETEDTPCVRSIPHYPVRRKRVLITPDDDRADPDQPEAAHVPAWFPPFPDKSTYMHTAELAQRESDPQLARQRASKHRRDAEVAAVAIARKVEAAATGQPVDGERDERLTFEPGSRIALDISIPTGRGDTDMLATSALPSLPMPVRTDGLEAPRELMDAMRERRKGDAGEGEVL